MVGMEVKWLDPRAKASRTKPLNKYFCPCPCPIVFFLCVFGHALPMKLIQPVFGVIAFYGNRIGLLPRHGIDGYTDFPSTPVAPLHLAISVLRGDARMAI